MQLGVLFPLLFLILFIMQDAYVSSSDIPGAKTGLADYFKSKSNATILVPESLVNLSSRLPPLLPPRSSLKKAHQAVALNGASIQASPLEEYQIIDCMNPLAEETQSFAIPTVAVQSSQLNPAGEEYRRLSSQSNQRDFQEGEQISRDTQNASPQLHVADVLPSPELTMGSRVQRVTTDPDNPVVFGVIRWMGGEVNSHGHTLAGVEMVGIILFHNNII